MAIDLAPELLDILACPNCHGSLAVDHDRDELVCLAADCGLAYPVRQGIPVLLIDEARRPGPDLPPGSASSAGSASPPGRRLDTVGGERLDSRQRRCRRVERPRLDTRPGRPCRGRPRPVPARTARPPTSGGPAADGDERS